MSQEEFGSNIVIKNTKSAVVLEWLEAFVLASFLVILLLIFVYKQISVVGSSMEPTLVGSSKSDPSRVGDRLIVSRMFYEPGVNDIVVIKSLGLEEIIIKRIVATENQVVDIDFDRGIVIVDGKIRNEPFIKEVTRYQPEEGYEYPITVPSGHVFVLGDNRNASTDSRDIRVGMIRETDIMGKAFFRIWPFDRIKKLN